MNALELILWLASISISAISGYFICIATNWTFFWIGILLLPFSFLLLYGLWLVFVFVWGKFLDTKKEITRFSPFYYSIVRLTDATLLRILNISYKRNGYEKMPNNHDYVLVCNHISNFDQMILIAALKKKHQPMSWISKPENMSFPIAGPFIHHSGFIPMDRNNMIKGMEAIKKGVSFLDTHKCAMGICPEGTRNKTNDPLLPFHAGSFKLAMWANVPIVVCCLKNTNKIKKNAPFRHTRVSVDIVGIINPDEYKDKTATEVSNIARNLILDDLNK